MKCSKFPWVAFRSSNDNCSEEELLIRIELALRNLEEHKMIIDWCKTPFSSFSFFSFLIMPLDYDFPIVIKVVNNDTVVTKSCERWLKSFAPKSAFIRSTQELEDFLRCVGIVDDNVSIERNGSVG